jgi:hypothetical protein
VFIAPPALVGILFCESFTISHGVVAVRGCEDEWQVRTNGCLAYPTDSINLATESSTRPSLSTLTTIGFMETMIGSEEAGRYCRFI